jgi:hypothetical protein
MEKGTLKVYAVSGLGGDKEEERKKDAEYVKMLVGAKDNDPRFSIIQIVTSRQRADLGQELSKQDVLNGMMPKQKKEHANDNEIKTSSQDVVKRMLMAFSQGGAAAFQLIAEGKLDSTNLELAAFEGLFMEANQALEHSVHGIRCKSYGYLRALPFLSYWLPLFARLVEFPHYKPAGSQPIHALEKFPKNMPVVFIQGDKDQRVPRKHAMLAYLLLRTLRKQGDDVFLIRKNSADDAIEQKRDHTRVLDLHDAPTFQAILRKYKLLPPKKGAEESDKALLAAAQPVVTDETLAKYVAFYHSTHAEQKTHERIEKLCDAATIVAGAALMYWAVKATLKRDSALNDALSDQQFILANSLAMFDQYFK